MWGHAHQFATSPARLRSGTAYICNVQIDGSDMVLEIDTGSSVSVISGIKWAKMCQKSELTLDTHNVPRLRTYAGTTIEPLGRTYVNVCHND